MDTLIHAFLSWQFLFFCLAIGAVIFVVRQVVEYGMENWWPLKQWKAAHKDAKLWRGLILPILPILLGQAGALLAKGYPYPEGFSSTSGRIVFGLVAGFTSGLIVRLFRSFLSDKVSEFKNNIQYRMNNLTPPPAPPPSNEPQINNIVQINNSADVSSEEVPKRGQP